MQPAAPGHVAQASRGRRTREKRTLSGPRSWLLGMGKRLVWLRRGTSRRRLRTGKWQNSRKRKARAQEGPRPTVGYARLGRGSLPPAEPEKNGPSAARAPGFWGWESALFGCAGPMSRRRLRTGKWKNSRKRKARAQEGPRPTVGYARLGRGSLPPKQLPVKAADFSFTAGNLAEALNPFFIFDKIQEGKSKHRPLSCKHN